MLAIRNTTIALSAAATAVVGVRVCGADRAMIAVSG
jgi:hypothetical protein